MCEKEESSLVSSGPANASPFEETDNKYEFNLISTKMEFDYFKIGTTIKEELDDSKLLLIDSLEGPELKIEEEGENVNLDLYCTSEFEGRYNLSI